MSLRTRNLVARAAAFLLALAAGRAAAQESAAELRPYVIVLVASESTAAESWRGAAAERGWGVSFFAPEERDPETSASALRELCAKLRRTHRVEGLRFHLAAYADEARFAEELLVRSPYDVQSLAVPRRALMTAADAPRYQTIIEMEKPLDFVAGFALRHLDETRPIRALDEAQRGPWIALDAFHDAAARADENTYFDLLADGGVFLGTDATERWTKAQFQAWAAPHFARESAWIYVPLERHIVLAPDGEHACFDEVLGNAGYGLCRGSGALRRIDGRWKIAQYDLAFLIPNERAREVVALLRGESGPSAPAATSAPTTIYLVRHAEKAAEGGSDPELSEAGVERAKRLAEVLRSVRFDALIASQYKRTQATLAPLASAAALVPKTLPAADVAALLAEVRGPLSGRTVLVCGHSNTVPQILRALGAAEAPAIEDGDYTNLFCVAIDGKTVRVQRLHY